MPWSESRKFVQDERGNVESSLVLIPLLTLFLITTQVSIAIHTRNMGRVATQDGASVAGISGNFSPSDTFIHIDSPDPQQKLELVVTHHMKNLPRVLPGLAGLLNREPVTDVSGIAVIENRR